MKKNPTRKIWIALATLEIVALLYPIKIYIEADQGDIQTRFLAGLLVVGVNFLLAMVDVVAIAIASA